MVYLNSKLQVMRRYQHLRQQLMQKVQGMKRVKLLVDLCIHRLQGRCSGNKIIQRGKFQEELKMEKITKIAALIVIVIALMFMLVGHLNKIRAMMIETSQSSIGASTPESAESNSDDKSDGFMKGFIYSQLINYALK